MFLSKWIGTFPPPTWASTMPFQVYIISFFSVTEEPYTKTSNFLNLELNSDNEVYKQSLHCFHSRSCIWAQRLYDHTQITSSSRETECCKLNPSPVLLIHEGKAAKHLMRSIRQQRNHWEWCFIWVVGARIECSI